ncbi:CPBP family glutamic-type intramembrane protease [Elizabethkingia meningoseptica]|uniref:CPBP family glutamic-type intramembrane protease n=1 Tax=Elizabethkingia meningoseptica TaxID=238 RepID=UPI000B35B80E|nr:CPBP family glutamic-type intramembrane protease [Elizabethkingia meningoseptica]
MSLFTPVIWIIILLPLFILALFKSKNGNLKYLAFFTIYFFADFYLQIFSVQYLSLKFLGLKFAWVPKILSLTLAVIFILSVSKNDRELIGFTTKTNTRSQVKYGILVFTGFMIFDIIFKLILFPKGGTFDLETFLFQGLLPGPSEEILFRGIYFWMLDKAFPPRWNFKGIKFGWGFIILTILFAVGHGVILTPDHHFKVDIITIVYLTLISSLSVGILRKLSGNLIFSALGHNFINTVNAIIRIL